MFRKEILGKRVRDLRTDANISQTTLAEYLGLGKTAVSMLETGQRATSVDVLVRLSEYFDVTIDYLVGKSEFPDYSASEDVIPYPYFPIRLKELREEKGLDIFTVAEMVEETPRNYAGYEEGEVLPRLGVICAIADYFDVSLDYLVGRSDEPSRH